MYIEPELKLNYNDVMIKPMKSKISSRSHVELDRVFVPRYGKSFSGVPIIAANMACGTFDMLDLFSQHHAFVAIAKFLRESWFVNIDKKIMDMRIKYGFYTIGMGNDELESVVKFKNHLRDNYFYDDGMLNDIKICIDIANGYTESFVEYVAKARKMFPKNVIIAGNVATPYMTKDLIIAGADYVKVGISQGSVCTTRLKTAIGYPQFSAVVECAREAKSHNAAGIVADGGIRSVGDIAKAICAGADFVMIGGLFAGTDECYGDVIYKNQIEKECDSDGNIHDVVIRKSFKKFYGMSSEYAQQAHLGEMKSYRTSEGRVEDVECCGSCLNILNDIYGGLRSTATYLNADNINKFHNNATFVRTNQFHDKF